MCVCMPTTTYMCAMTTNLDFQVNYILIDSSTPSPSLISYLLYYYFLSNVSPNLLLITFLQSDPQASPPHPVVSSCVGSSAVPAQGPGGGRGSQPRMPGERLPLGYRHRRSHLPVAYLWPTCAAVPKASPGTRPLHPASRNQKPSSRAG